MSQLILPLSCDKKYHPDEFIVSSSNCLAYEALIRWRAGWGIRPYESSLLIKGPSSSGKTYLTKIWQSLSDAFIITNEMPGEKILLQRNNFIIEDIENRPEKTVLHLFNLLHENRKYFLITTSNFHNNKFKLPDLSSRINSVLHLEISPPDDELMKILIFKYFSNSSVKISLKILEFLLINLPRNYEQILFFLEKINKFALTRQRKVTIQLIKETLSCGFPCINIS